MNIVVLNNETWVICGGRNFSTQELFDDVMSRLIGMWGCPGKIVHGNASGADTMADSWGHRMAVEVVAVDADWKRYGKAAGPIRNEDILMDHRPKRLIAFPGGRGTADMVQRAKNRLGAIEVVEIKLSENVE